MASQPSSSLPCGRYASPASIDIPEHGVLLRLDGVLRHLSISDYALPISMGGLIISLMTNQAYDTSSRRCSPREIVITPASANLCPVGQVSRGTYDDRHRLAEIPLP